MTWAPGTSVRWCRRERLRAPTGARALAEHCSRFEQDAGILEVEARLAGIQELADDFDRARMALTQELAHHA